MEERKFYGEWWIPEGEGSRKPGVLTVAGDGDLQLELIGGFDLNVTSSNPDGSTTVSGASKDLPAVHGICEGTLVTLVNCFSLLSRGGWFVGEPAFQRLYAQRALIGIHLHDVTDPLFKRATVRIENLTSWLAMPLMTRSWGFENGIASAELKVADSLSATFDGWTISAGPSLRGFSYTETRESHRVSGDATAELYFDPPDPSAIENFDRFALEFMDLVTLASGSPSGVISVFLDQIEDEVIEAGDGHQISRPRQVELVGRRIHTAEPDAEAVKPHNFLFTCRDLPFDVVAPAWLALRRKASAACNVFFGMRYATPGFTEVRLLLLSVSLEALHRSLIGNTTDLPGEKFQQLRETVLAALEDLEERAWLKARLYNEPSFKERALSLAALPPATTVARIIPNLEQWAKEMRDVRNGIAHVAGEGVTHDIFKLQMQTAALLSLVLICQLGLSDEILQRVADNVLHLDF
ncbi:MAG: hypothetical protein JWQ12_1154 [Glaciihabitans sp.]|nr:hypothetical protein [Glaciihabitans sp.]